MKVHRAIIHRILKEVNEVPRFNGSSICLASADPLVLDLVEQLDSNFQERASFTYAVFQEGEPVFKRELGSYMQNPADDVFKVKPSKGHTLAVCRPPVRENYTEFTTANPQRY